MRNGSKLYSLIDSELVSHFLLSEFENHSGYCMVDPSMVKALELTRRDLIKDLGIEVRIRITCCIRTDEDNAALAARLGWTDQGGAVARDSKHLPKYGGIAVDFVVYVPSKDDYVVNKVVGKIARRYFTYVNDSYSDGHVHADMRKV